MAVAELERAAAELQLARDTLSISIGRSSAGAGLQERDSQGTKEVERAVAELQLRSDLLARLVPLQNLPPRGKDQMGRAAQEQVRRAGQVRSKLAHELNGPVKSTHRDEGAPLRTTLQSTWAMHVASDPGWSRPQLLDTCVVCKDEKRAS